MICFVAFTPQNMVGGIPASEVLISTLLQRSGYRLDIEFQSFYLFATARVGQNLWASGILDTESHFFLWTMALMNGSELRTVIFTMTAKSIPTFQSTKMQKWLAGKLRFGWTELKQSDLVCCMLKVLRGYQDQPDNERIKLHTTFAARIHQVSPKADKIG